MWLLGGTGLGYTAQSSDGSGESGDAYVVQDENGSSGGGGPSASEVTSIIERIGQTATGLISSITGHVGPTSDGIEEPPSGGSSFPVAPVVIGGVVLVGLGVIIYKALGKKAST